MTKYFLYKKANCLYSEVDTMISLSSEMQTITESFPLEFEKCYGLIKSLSVEKVRYRLLQIT